MPRLKCDYEGKCKNKAYREVYYKDKKKCGMPGCTGGHWSYLCRKHFEEEKKRMPKSFYMYCGVDR